VITDADPLRPGGPDVQALQLAAEIAAAAAAASAGRKPLSSTRPTLTSGQLTPAAANGRRGGKSVHRLITTVCRTSPSPGPVGG
jgi:hypothetical protein